jgi:glycine cleavage system aminomethyltransferase T/glycine/D-amino acid oxidase-like deaminating enzyme
MESFRVVVIGGGVAGASIAYHLAERGWTDVLLVDRADLTSGSTFHSAGLVGQLRSSVTLTRMMMHSVELYRRLAAETGVDPGWHEVGSLRLASSPERLQELQRLAGWGRTFGLPLEIVSTEEALDRWPLFDPTGVLGAAWLPTDGHIDPTNLTLALAEGARRRGVEVRTGTRVVGIDVERGRVCGVRTDGGPIAAEIVVNAGGMYAHQIGRLAGVEIPIVPFEHQYLLTEPIDGVGPELPTMRDPDRLIYFRGDAGGTLVAGGYERDPASWRVDDGPPPDFNHTLLREDWERFAPLADAMQGLVPAMREVGVVRMINGPEAFSPDGEFILGETDVGGFFVATGFGAHGIAGAGGVGRVIAEWIVDGEPGWDLWRMDVRRLGAQYRSRRYAEVRAREIYATNYDIHYPGQERAAGRPLKTAPTYARLAALGASFGEKAGWERANWFASNEDPRHEERRPRGWAGEHWSTAIVTEHLACRERVALFDESSFAKIEVEGPGACAFLQWVCANDIDRPVGSVVYTQLLTARGGIACDLTVARLAEDRFRIVTGTAFGGHDLGWLRTQLKDREGVILRDVTGAWGCLGLWGPRARDVLEPLTSDDLSDDGFPYLTGRELVVGHVPCWAQRITYVGELGWELYAPTEYLLTLFDTLLAAGREHGIVAAGYRAIDALRLEKGYLAWGTDITPEEDPFQAGLGFAVALDKEFLGKEALLRRREQPRPRLACLALDDERAMALGNEPVFADGRVVSRVTSAGIGYAVGRSIALCYLEDGLATPGTALEVEVFGERVGASVVEAPLYDPKGERIRS